MCGDPLSEREVVRGVLCICESVVSVLKPLLYGTKPAANYVESDMKIVSTDLARCTYPSHRL